MDTGLTVIQTAVYTIRFVGFGLDRYVITRNPGDDSTDGGESYATLELALAVGGRWLEVRNDEEIIRILKWVFDMEEYEQGERT